MKPLNIKDLKAASFGLRQNSGLVYERNGNKIKPGLGQKDGFLLTITILNL